MKILLPHTRELCYYSGSFFLQKIADELESRGIEAVFMELSDDFCDLNRLEDALDGSFDAIIDVNSKMPYMLLDDDTRLVDAFGIPFFNYVVDHPLYHHPGLFFELKNYHMIGIDQNHCAFAKNNYTHLKGSHYLPIAGTKANQHIDFSMREIPVLVPVTYEEEHDIMYTLRDMGPDFYELGLFMIDLLENDLPIEDCLKKALSYFNKTPSDYSCRDFAELLNHCYPVDKYVRFSRRYKVVEALGKADIPATIMGDGWLTTDLEKYPSLNFIPSKSISVSFEVMANSKILLDINPLFAKGLHDRVSSAFANSCICFSDMNLLADEKLANNHNIISYNTHDLDSLCDVLKMNIEKPASHIADAGYELYQNNYTWKNWVDKFLTILYES